MPTLKQLQHEYDTTRGLRCIDRHPADVDYEWIKKNAFQLKALKATLLSITADFQEIQTVLRW